MLNICVFFFFFFFFGGGGGVSDFETNHVFFVCFLYFILVFYFRMSFCPLGGRI